MDKVKLPGGMYSIKNVELNKADVIPNEISIIKNEQIKGSHTLIYDPELLKIIHDKEPEDT